MKRISNKVDKLAALRAQINELKEVEAKLEADLKALGLGQHNGTGHYVNVHEQQGADKVDWKAIAAKLNPSHQLVAAHTKPGKTTVVLKLYGYKAGDAKVAA